MLYRRSAWLMIDHDHPMTGNQFEGIFSGLSQTRFLLKVFAQANVDSFKFERLV